MVRTVAGSDGWLVIVEQAPRDLVYGPFRTPSEAAEICQRLRRWADGETSPPTDSRDQP